MSRGANNRLERRALLSMAALLAVSACGTEQGEPVGPETSGFLRPVEAQEGVVLAAEKDGTSGQRAATPATDPQPQVEAPRPAADEPRAPEATTPARTNEGGEPSRAPEAPDEATLLELGAALVQRDPAAFDQLLASKGRGLPDARRRLLSAVNELRAGQEQRASELAAALEASAELSTRERDLLQRALHPDGAHAIPASLSVAAPLERALELALLDVGARRLAAQGDYAGAARDLSQLLLAEVSGPWEADRDTLARWSAALMSAQEKHRWNPRGDWPAIEVTVQPGDSLIAIRKRVLAEHPELLLCTGLIARANGLRDEQAIQPDDVLRIPTDRASALVDVSARWTFYLHAGEVVAAWEVGVGKEAGSTRPGTYAISLKQSEPMWFRPGQDPVPYAAPGNPLGTRWLEWGEDGRGSHLGFHGTDDPSGVGGRVSEGCVRMRNEDVEILFDVLPLGAEVVVQP